MLTHLPAFIAVAALLIVTPGVDMALVTRNALRHGRQPALWTAWGIAAGLLVWVLAAALGIAALLQASATAAALLKLAGAAYLLYLGSVTLLGSCRRRAHHGETENSARRGVPLPSLPARAAFRQGVLSNLLNPKIAVFFTSFIPQFIDAGDPALTKTLLFGLVFNGMGMIWLTGYALAASRAGRVLRRPAVRVWLDRLTGTALVGFGLRLLAPARR